MRNGETTSLTSAAFDVVYGIHPSIAADDRDVDLMGGFPMQFDRSNPLCAPRRLAAMYQLEWFSRAKLYGYLYAVGYDGYRGIRERDVSHLYTHIFADRYAFAYYMISHCLLPNSDAASHRNLGGVAR